MLDVTQLVDHIRDGDALADDSAVALARLIEGAPPTAGQSSGHSGDVPASSDSARAQAAAEAVRQLRRYIHETPMPLPSAVWALGKEQDPRFADTFASLVIRALDRRDEPLAYQALAALTVLPADAVPVDTVRLAAETGPDDVRDLAEDWLRLPRR
jgi:acetylornithine deacetylase/succinyl-diaminopimelate desuccinylase-like protein